VLSNLIAASGQLRTLFTNLAPCSQPHSDSQCGFANASLPSLQALGKASVVGKVAVQAAAPTIRDLNNMTGGSNCLSHDLALDASGATTGFRQTCLPELAQNLALVLSDLDNPGRAVEPDSRSPGGKGFSGLEALLWYVFVQPLSINSYSQFGHLLAVDAYISPQCSPYATPQSIANGLAQYGSSYRQCYAFLGPNQPGVNETDPSNPSACVPDPGGAPPGETGPKTSACKLGASSTGSKTSSDTPSAHGAGANTPAASTSGSSGSPGAASGPGSGASSGASPAGSGSSAASTSTGSSGASQAQQLLNYLLAP
jgi:hypothetical protein